MNKKIRKAIKLLSNIEIQDKDIVTYNEIISLLEDSNDIMLDAWTELVKDYGKTIDDLSK